MRQWKQGKKIQLSKFKGTKRTSPLDILVSLVLKNYPDVRSITQVGMAKEDAKTLHAMLAKHAKLKYPKLLPKKLQVAIGMAWLEMGPVELPSVKKGYIYISDGE